MLVIKYNKITNKIEKLFCIVMKSIKTLINITFLKISGPNMYNVFQMSRHKKISGLVSSSKKLLILTW